MSKSETVRAYMRRLSDAAGTDAAGQHIVAYLMRELEKTLDLPQGTPLGLVDKVRHEPALRDAVQAARTARASVDELAAQSSIDPALIAEALVADLEG